MSNGQPVRVKTPLGEDLLFRSMELSEELSRLFQCDLELVSAKEDLELDDMLGQEVTVEIDRPEGGTRFIHGWVSEVSQSGRSGDLARYTASLRPWFWFLTRTADCKIFQEIKVPDIIKEVFRENGFSDFRDALTRSYRTWEYCVQYRETDFNFLSRLMEQEGIYYFFEHEAGKDTLVLADADTCHSAIKDYERIPYYSSTDNAVREEHVYDWRLSRAVRTGAYALSAFHFVKPRANLEVNKSITRAHSRADYEVFDYPGEYFETSEGETYVAARIEELQAQYERVQGETDALGLYPGGLFELEEHPRKDQNREYLVVSTRHSLTLGDYASGSGSEGMEYACSFEAMESKCQFRAERITPKPFVQGPQTAIVSGPSGEEIHTDEYGRVKVQFKWDRYGASDENSSCWVRVAQVWAGGQWGGMTIPRIGQEVIVDFIEGDPDRPIVTGRVYNADNMPPYGLPDNKTQSGFKTRSTKGASADNFNEIRFEDKIGEEEMYVHAERDQNVVVENNQTITVGFDDQEDGDRVIAVHNDEAIDIGRDRRLRVARDKFETIERNKKVEVSGGHNESIGKSMTVMVASSLTETVGVNYAETVGAAMELSVGAAMAMQIGGTLTQSVGASKSESVGGSKSTSIGASLNETVGAAHKLQVGEDSEIDVGGTSKLSVKKNHILQADKIQFVGKNEISIKTGSAEIVMKKNGDITIKGNKINIKGSGDVILKGSKIKEN